MDDWIAGKIPKNDTLVLGPTPEVFQKNGLSTLAMTIDQKHVDYAVNSTKNEDHNLGLEMMKKLPEMMENPVAIIESDSRPTDSAVVILRGKVNGNQHIAAVRISGDGKINGLRIDANHMASTYGRKNAIKKLLTNAIKKKMPIKLASSTGRSQWLVHCSLNPGNNSPGALCRTASFMLQ